MVFHLPEEVRELGEGGEKRGTITDVMELKEKEVKKKILIQEEMAHSTFK